MSAADTEIRPAEGVFVDSSRSFVASGREIDIVAQPQNSPSPASPPAAARPSTSPPSRQVTTASQ
jgi:hypothetical protein